MAIYRYTTNTATIEHYLTKRELKKITKPFFAPLGTCEVIELSFQYSHGFKTGEIKAG